MPATREKYIDQDPGSSQNTLADEKPHIATQSVPTAFRSACLITACSVAMVVNVCPNRLMCSMYPIPINLSYSSDRKYYECVDCTAGYWQGPQYPGAKAAVVGFSLLTGFGTIFTLCNDAIHEGRCSGMFSTALWSPSGSAWTEESFHNRLIMSHRILSRSWFCQWYSFLNLILVRFQKLTVCRWDYDWRPTMLSRNGRGGHHPFSGTLISSGC